MIQFLIKSVTRYPSPATRRKVLPEYDSWLRKWKSELTKPASLQPALEVKHFTSEVHITEMIKMTLFIELMTKIFASQFHQVGDTDIFPNLNCFPGIACSIQVTYPDNQQANSTLKRVKGYFRTAMTRERMSGLFRGRYGQGTYILVSKHAQT